MLKDSVGFFLVSCGILVSAVVSQELRNSSGKIEELAAGIWNLEVQIDSVSSANLTWLDCSGSFVVFDSGYPEGINHAQKILRQRIPTGVEKYLVIPHEASELPADREFWAGATIFAHQETGKRMIGRMQDSGMRLSTFTRQMALYFSNRTVELLHFGAARTAGDLLLRVPEEGLVIAGHLCGMEPLNFTEKAQVAQWIRVLGEIQSISPLTVLPGSGSPEPVSLLQEQRTYLTAIQNQAQEWYHQGKGISELEHIGASADLKSIFQQLTRSAGQEFRGGMESDVVAIPREEIDVIEKLVYVARRLSPSEIATLSAVASHVDIRQVESRDEALQHASEAHGADAWLCTSEFLQKASRLRWIQAGSAGVERYLRTPEIRNNPQIVFTNMKGMHGPSIADHAFASLLLLTRELRFYESAFQEKRWDRGRRLQPSSLYGKTMLVVGMGGIGSQIAQRAYGFGMRVMGTVRTKRVPPYYVERLEAASALHDLLPLADVVALAVPLTQETESLIGEEEFQIMKEGAYLINIARGKVVDTQALVKALSEGTLSGACLDVTDPEPLPADHPLWEAPNLVLTPHVSGRSQVTTERRRALLLENMRRFSAGEPLLNVVDKAAGY